MKLFQDVAGLVPAGLAGQTVGRLLRGAGGPAALQPVAALRPTLARWPKGGRRNLAISSLDLTAWQRLNCLALTPEAGDWTGFEASALHSQQQVHCPVTPGSRSYALEIRRDSAPFSLGFRAGAISGTVWGQSDVLPASAAVSGAGSISAVDALSFRLELSLPVLVQEGGTPVFFMRLNPGSQAVGTRVFVRHIQFEAGAPGPHQRVVSAYDVTEAGRPEIWHLCRDSGDSLPVTLAAGSYEIAWVTPLGAMGYSALSSDGASGLELLQAERLADVLLRPGSFSAAEKALLSSYWQQRYGSG